MPTSPRSCARSARCLPTELDLRWRPSRWQSAALALLAGLAPAALLDSALPRALAWPLALLAFGHGLRLLQRHRRSPPRRLQAAPGGPLRIDGVPLRAPALAWRGPLAVLHGRAPDGARIALAWWPDTLPPPARRELRKV